MSVETIDKVEVAERKLSGLCLKCGEWEPMNPSNLKGIPPENKGLCVGCMWHFNLGGGIK